MNNYSDAFDEDLYKQVLMSSPLHFGIIKYCLNILKTTSKAVYISVTLFFGGFKKSSVICCVGFNFVPNIFADSTSLSLSMKPVHIHITFL